MSFLRDAANTLVLQVCAAAFQFATGVALSRALHADGSGVVGLLTLMPTIGVYVASVGYGSAAMRMVAQERDHDGAVVGNALLVALSSGGVLASLVAIAAPSLRAFVGPPCDALAVALALAAIPVLTLEDHLGLVLTGMHEVALGNLVKLIQAALFFVAVATLWWIGRLDPSAALVAWVGSYLVVDVVAWVGVVRRLASRVRLDGARLASGLWFGLRTVPGNLAMFLLFRVDLFLVRHFRDLGEVGIYARASQLAVVFQFAARAIERAFLPRIMRADEDETARLTPAVTRSFVLVMSLVAIAAAALAFPLVPLLFGEEFRPAALQFALFLPGMVVANVGFLCNGALMSRGRAGAGAAPATVCLALNVGMNWLLIPRFGANGAAFDSLVCYAIYGVAVAGRYAVATGTRRVDLFVPRIDDARAVLGMAQRAFSRTSVS